MHRQNMHIDKASNVRTIRTQTVLINLALRSLNANLGDKSM